MTIFITNHLCCNEYIIETLGLGQFWRYFVFWGIFPTGKHKLPEGKILESINYCVNDISKSF